jgi:hypothetical protein
VKVIKDVFNVKPKVFIPPYYTFNSDTLTAAINSGFTHFSSEYWYDPPPYNFVNPPIFHFPTAAFTYNTNNDVYQEGVTHDVTFDQVTSQIKTYGFSVVKMTPGEFTARYNGAYTAGINETMATELKGLLQNIQAAGLKVVFIHDIQNKSTNWVPTPTVSANLLGISSSGIRMNKMWFIVIGLVGGAIIFIAVGLALIAFKRAKAHKEGPEI